MDVNLRPEAQDDLVSAAAYFNDKNAGWGEHFLSTIELDLAQLEKEAGIHAIHNGLPCKFAKAFPFAIYYRIENGFFSRIRHFELPNESWFAQDDTEGARITMACTPMARSSESGRCIFLPLALGDA